VTLIQRFGNALNLNVHFHLLVLDGVYHREADGRLRFVPVPAPSPEELKGLVQRMAARVGRAGLITRDIDNAYLAFDPGDEAPIHGLLGHSRIVPRPRTAAATERAEVSASDWQRTMSWAQRLTRVFAIDLETCRHCGGRLRVIASIETPAVIERILEHLGHTAESVDPAPPSRVPPQADR
jgi:hypothetical protein